MTPLVRWAPRDDQIVAVQWAIEHEAAGIFAKPGVGKTAIFCQALQMLQQVTEAGSAIVVTPLRPLYATWPAEIAKWHFPFTIGILHGPKKETVLRGPKCDIYLINPEGINWLAVMASRGRIPAWVDTLCVDESTKFKNGQTQRFKYLKTMLERFKNRYILTGTPQTRSLEDLWAQVFILDGGKRLGAYISHFRRQYMVNTAPPMASYPDWQPMVGAVEEVYRKIGDICLTVPSPRTEKPLFNPVAVQLPDAVASEYKRMEKQFYIELRAGTITAANAGVKSIKLRQITGGFIYDEDKTPIKLHDAKLDAMVDFIEELGAESLLIAVNFDHEAQAVQARLKREFGLTVPYFGGGGLKGVQAATAVEAWNAGQTRILVANPQSAAHGLNLQHGGSNVLWYSLTYNWEDWEQFNARLDRPGQDNTVVISALMCDNSIDHAVLETLNGRGDADKSLYSIMKRNYEQAKQAA